MKEYFSHDFHARSELSEIQMKYGLSGIGAYWCLVEILHEHGGTIAVSAIPSIAYELHADEDLIMEVCKYFKIDGGKVTCERVIRNLEHKEKVSSARRAAVNSRYEKEEETPKENPAQIYQRYGDAAEEDLLERVAELRQYERDTADHDFAVLADNVEAILTCEYGKKDRKILLNSLNAFLCEDNKQLLAIIEQTKKKFVEGKIKNRYQYLISAIKKSAKENWGVM